MKEIIHLAEEFKKIWDYGYINKELKGIGVEYIPATANVGSLWMGSVSRTFGRKAISIPDELWESDEARNMFIEEYTLKLNTAKSILKELGSKRIEEKIVELQEELQQVAA